jgi:hypothetical protein
MNVFKAFLVSRSEKHLQKYRGARGHMRAEFLNAYNLYLPDIEQCYAHAGYWHGTGRYQYYHARTSRYEDADAQRVRPIFESILDAGALTTHAQESWVSYDGQDLKTVSVAPTRMHARLYAHIHLQEGVWLEYIFGGTRFWIGFFIFLFLASLQLSRKAHSKKQARVRISLLSRNFYKYGRVWASAVCNLDKYKILPIWRIYDLRSDIAGNYGVLFGIKREAIQDDGVFPLVKNLELRINRAIQLSDMTHVEVPLENVEETKRLLLKKKISLPVIPLEFGELYCSQFPLTQIVHV